MANPRALALNALVQIEQKKAYSHLILNQTLNQHPDMDERDKSLLTELVYGTVQHKRLLDFYMEPLIKQGLDQLDDWVRQLLRLSVYQLAFLERIPAHAVVNEAVNLAKKKGHRGIQGLVNGVLRNILRHPFRPLEEIRDPIDRLGVKTSHPTWLVKRWVNQYGLSITEKICQANNERPHFTVRTNSLKSTRKSVITKLCNAGYQAEESERSPYGITIANPANITRTSLYEQGYFTIQSESSMLVAPLVDPKPGMKVLDACAAPGGKTTHLAELMQNQGTIIAYDIHKHKLRLVRALAERLGLTIISTHHGDAAQVSAHRWGYFDRILLDAPCSGLGVIKHKPDLKWNKKPDDIKKLADLQNELLKGVSQVLKVGGELVYSTCTIDKEENQYLIERFLSEHPHFHLVGNMEQIFPYDFGSDGFFMVKLRKTDQ
jgi:16S rRNA (cytosine967-C5)-methyltransferase